MVLGVAVETDTAHPVRRLLTWPEEVWKLVILRPTEPTGSWTVRVFDEHDNEVRTYEQEDLVDALDMLIEDEFQTR